MKHLWAPWRMSYLRAITSHPGEDCLFCDKLRAGDDAQNHILYRGAGVFVILNLYPYSNGHLMIAPNRHLPSLEDLDETTLSEFMTLTRRCLVLLRAAYNPDGFNVGVNIGSAAGAGVADHVHQHIVPRWAGDTNFMTTLGETRIIPQWIDETYAELRALWLEKFGSQGSAPHAANE